MKTTKKRQSAARLLLAVFLPMLILSSLHIHETTQTTEPACIQCIHHQCGGHLMQLHTQLHQCVLCQFLTLPMMAAMVLAVALILYQGKFEFVPTHSRLTFQGCGVISLRGPPCCLKK